MKDKSSTCEIVIRKNQKTNERTTLIPICPKLAVPKKTSIGFFLLIFI